MRKLSVRNGSKGPLLGAGVVLIAAAAGLLISQTRLAVDKAKLRAELSSFVIDKFLAGFSEDIEVDLADFSKENLPIDLEGGVRIPVKLEQRLRNATYINEMLSEVKVLGYDMTDISIMDLGLKYAELDEKFRKVWLEGTREHKTKEQMFIESRRLILENVSGLIGRALDDKTPEISGEIADGLNGLLWEGYDKTKEILDAVDAYEKDPKLEWSDELAKKLKIRGTFFEYFQDFELNYRAIKDQIADPAEAYQAFTILYRGMSSQNPGDKVDAAIKMMSTFGGKVPVLGKFIELYAQVAEEMLNAVGRLGEILRKRQGYCVGAGTTGQIASRFQDQRSLKFAQQFPNGGTACPAATEGVYKDIYIDIMDASRLYFWTGSSYVMGMPAGGIQAVKSLIVWLRKTGHAADAADAAFLARAYNLAPGFLERDRQARDLASELGSRVRALAARLGMCSKEALQKFLLDVGRLRGILAMLGEDTEQVEYFPSDDDLLVDRIHDDAIYKGTDDFWTRLKETVSHLDTIVILAIEGRVVDEDGKAQRGMAVSVRPESNLLKDCSRLTSDSDGGFIATLYKHKDESYDAVLQAEGDNKKSDETRVAVEGTGSVYSCTIPVESTAVAFLALTPDKKTIKVGDKIVFKIVAELVDGTTKTIDNSRAVWSGAEGGVFTATKTGDSFGVTATYREKTASAAVTVEEEKLLSLTITKDVENVTVNQPVNFRASANYEGGKSEDITDDPEANFYPSRSAAYGSVGRGWAYVTYKGLKAELNFNVGSSGASLVIAPENETIAVGDTIKFAVSLVLLGFEAEDVTAKCVPPNPSFTATQTGHFTVTVTYPISPQDSLTATAGIEVKKIERIIVDPAAATVKIDEAKDFVARAVYSDGTSSDVTGRVVWTGGPRFQSKKAGTYSVSAAYGAAAGSATVTVTGEKAEDPCSPAAALASIQKLEALVNNIKECRNRVDRYHAAFFQAAASAGNGKICNLFKVAYCYANAKSNAIRIIDFLLEADDLTADVLRLIGTCPDLAAGLKGQSKDVAAIVSLLGSVKGADDACTAKVNAMLARLNQDGCDAADVDRAGRNNVRPDDDPDHIQTLDGTVVPVCYDWWLWSGAPAQPKQNWSLDGRAEGLADFALDALRFSGQKEGSVTHPDGARGTFTTTGNNIRIVMKRTVVENGKSVDLTYTFIGSDAGGSLLIGTYTVEGSDGRRQRGGWRAVKK